MSDTKTVSTYVEVIDGADYHDSSEFHKVTDLNVRDGALFIERENEFCIIYPLHAIKYAIQTVDE